MKYRRKPCIVEAIRLTEQSIEELLRTFYNLDLRYFSQYDKETGETKKYLVGAIITQENEIVRVPKDYYIIKDEFGNVKICNPYTFEKKYEVAE